MVIKGQWTSECTSCGNWQPELISSPDSPIVTHCQGIQQLNCTCPDVSLENALVSVQLVLLFCVSYFLRCLWSSTQTLCSRGWEQLCSGEGKRKGKVRGRLRGRGGCEERCRNERMGKQRKTALGSERRRKRQWKERGHAVVWALRSATIWLWRAYVTRPAWHLAHSRRRVR